MEHADQSLSGEPPSPIESAEHPIRRILRTPLYRGALLSLFITGLGGAAATPQIASYLVNELDASLRTAGLFYLTSLTAPVAGYLIGARSDRTGQRLIYFRICSFAGFLGWLAFAFAPQLWVPFVISATILAFAGAAMSQLFAAIHDDISVNPDVTGDGVFAYIRMAATAGWIIGPVIGTSMAATTGTRSVLIFTAICALAQLIPLGTIQTAPPVSRTTRTSVAGQDSVGTRVTFRDLVPLLVFTALCLNINASEAVKHAFLPIYMTETLNLSARMQGMAIGIQPLVEFPLIPVAMILAHRFGSFRIVATATAIAVIGNVLFARADSAADVLIAQALMGVVWGLFAALGVLIAQRLLPIAVATASGVFMSSGAIGSAFGGFLGGIGASALGLPAVFIIPAGFCLIATIGLIVMDRRTVLNL